MFNYFQYYLEIIVIWLIIIIINYSPSNHVRKFKIYRNCHKIKHYDKK